MITKVPPTKESHPRSQMSNDEMAREPARASTIVFAVRDAAWAAVFLAHFPALANAPSRTSAQGAVEYFFRSTGPADAVLAGVRRLKAFVTNEAGEPARDARGLPRTQELPFGVRRPTADAPPAAVEFPDALVAYIAEAKARYDEACAALLRDPELLRRMLDELACDPAESYPPPALPCGGLRPPQPPFGRSPTMG